MYQKEKKMFKEIVVAFDGSDHAETAILTACDMAERYSAKLHVVHVPDVHERAITVGSAAVVFPVDEDALQESGETMIKRAEQIAKDAGRTFSSTDILSGAPGDAILASAKEKGADLIVSGRRGHSQLKGILMGSVSQKLSSGANCAVLTVK
jgi:nucleotide-binding universal stress UspA family protein